MLLFYIIFGDRNPPYPALGSNIPSAKRPGQRFHSLQCRGSSPSLRFVNRHGGTLRRAGWFVFTKTYSWGKWRIYLRLLQESFTSRVPCVPVFDVPASASHTSPRPILEVLKSLVSRRQVPSPHTRVAMSPSPCPRPTFIHSQTKENKKTPQSTNPAHKSLQQVRFSDSVGWEPGDELLFQWTKWPPGSVGSVGSVGRAIHRFVWHVERCHGGVRIMMRQESMGRQM